MWEKGSEDTFLARSTVTISQDESIFDGRMIIGTQLQPLSSVRRWREDVSAVVVNSRE